MTVAIRQLRVPREHRLITQGQSVEIIVDVADVGLTSILLDSSSVPVISLYDPNGNSLASDAAMLQLSKGIYSYTYQTSALNALGIYTATLTVVDSSGVARVDNVAVFKIIKTSTL